MEISYLIHECEHLQCQHVLPQIISVFSNHFDWSIHNVSRVSALELQPEGLLQKHDN